MSNALRRVLTGYRRIESLQRRIRRQLKDMKRLFRQLDREARRARQRSVRGMARRAPRGALRSAIRGALSGRRVLRPAEIVAAILKAGYKTASTPRVLYTSVYLALKKDPSIRKTAAGFKLRARGLRKSATPR